MKKHRKVKPRTPTASDFREALEKHIVLPGADELAKVAADLSNPPVAKPSHDAVLATMSPAIPSRGWEQTAQAFDCLGAALVWLVMLLVGAFFLALAVIVAWEAGNLLLPMGDSFRHLMETQP